MMLTRLNQLFMKILKQFNTGLLFSFIVLAGCITKPAYMSSVDYDEDLSVYRLNYTDSVKVKESKNQSSSTEAETITYNTPNIKPSHDVTSSLNVFLDSVAQRNRQYDYYTGYTIQVYSGQERQKATETKDDVYMVLPDAKPAVHFESPFWKVKVGKFYNTIEAQKTFVKIKAEFPNAIIVPEKFKLNQ
jgi:hypothetical protein